MLLLESINQVQTSVHLFQPARVKFYLLFFSRNLLRNIFQLDVAAFQPFGKFPGSRIYFLQARHCIQALFQYGKQTALIGVHRLTGTEQSGLYLFGMAQRIGLLLQFFLFSGSIGTPITKLFDACGGLKDETYKLIMGGPMMGLAQYDVDVTVGKGTGAMLAFADKEEQYVEDPQCIRCGKCVGVCPIRLEPVFMYKYLMKGDVDTWQNVLHGMDCIECGACTYTCPARLPLTHAFRLGKQEVNNARMAAKAKAEAEAKAAAEKKEA